MNTSKEYQKQLFDLTEQIIQSMTELVKQFGKEKVEETGIAGLFLPIEGFEFPLLRKRGIEPLGTVNVTDLWFSKDKLALMTDNSEAIYFPCKTYAYDSIYMALNLPAGCSDIWPCRMTVEQMLLALKQAEESAGAMA